MASLKEEKALAALTEDVLQATQSAKLLAGYKRRRSQAETTLKDCRGSARRVLQPSDRHPLPGRL
jgi:hypothetical protein